MMAAVHHVTFGAVINEISGLLISVGQCGRTAYTGAHCDSRQTEMLFSSGLWTSIT
jgi:hypothetical protein